MNGCSKINFIGHIVVKSAQNGVLILCFVHVWCAVSTHVELSALGKIIFLAFILN
jgi:hypothetical protein